MNEIQKCEFDLLKRFIEVCKKYNLRYYLLGGTALGAIRHKGFIPWDDDIDLGMPRPDYEKFLLLQNEFDDQNYFIQTWQTDPNYIYNYAKLRDSKTTFIEDRFMYHRINHGVWIDIFPIDGCPDVKEDPKKFKKTVLKTWSEAFLCYLFALRRKIKARTFFRDLGLNIGAYIAFWGNIGHYRNKRLDKRMKKYPFETSAYLANWYGTNPKKSAMPRDIYDGVSYGTFEGIEVCLPNKCDEYLTRMFGDYMTPPPPEKQIGHHYNKGLDLNKSYVDYIEENRI